MLINLKKLVYQYKYLKLDLDELKEEHSKLTSEFEKEFSNILSREGNKEITEEPKDKTKSKKHTDESVKDMDKWLLINKKFSAIWPNISKKQEPMKDHEKFRNIKDKYDKHFSEKPGK